MSDEARGVHRLHEQMEAATALLQRLAEEVTRARQTVALGLVTSAAMMRAAVAAFAGIAFPIREFPLPRE
ncbi:MAG TPA: hypothetical protein VGU65_06075 [Frateuria sp.]|uniref:hypothetical protein n=1 Tax=Frateuria sp. TaxID=2211372 RepID=UPI002DF1469C|nr:hypothetical protein [Frateuria sp.]